MLLKCSADMQKGLKIKAEASEEIDRLFSWCVHTIKIDRRNCVVLMNCASRFYVVLYGLCAKDFMKFKDNIIGYLKEALVSYHISSEIIDKYLNDCGEIIIGKNNNRSDISRINQACITLKNYVNPDLDCSGDGLFKEIATSKLNGSMIYCENNNYYNPDIRFFDLLKDKYDVKLYNEKMYKLKITLDFPDFEISREIIVPSFCTFKQMHNVIQNCFNWQNYHLYEFTVEKDNEIKLLIIPKAMIREYEGMALPYETICDTEYTLEDCLEKEKKIFYCYDMGDNWVHMIELQEVIYETDSISPVCVKVTGKAPPEDCGGIEGYQDLIESVDNGDKDSISWSVSMCWFEQTEKTINCFLKRSIY